jgi:ribosomal protein S18 acetylase RimI-like enzyme
MACTGLVRMRRATVGDAPDIARVHVRTVEAAYRGLVPDKLLRILTYDRRLGWWKGELELLSDEHRPWVAVDGDGVVGFVHAGPSRDEAAGNRVAEVYAIYVDPECQGRGFGRDLLKHAVRDLHAHGYERATVWVLRDNEASRGFYEAAKWHDDKVERTEMLAGSEVPEVRYSLKLA